MYEDTITSQNFNYATPIFCDNIPLNVIALKSDIHEHSALKPKHIL